MTWSTACGTAYNAGIWLPEVGEACPTYGFDQFCAHAYDAGFGTSVSYPDDGAALGGSRSLWIARCANDLLQGDTFGIGGDDNTVKGRECQTPPRVENPVACHRS